MSTLWVALAALLLAMGCTEERPPREPPDPGERYTVPQAWKKVRKQIPKAAGCFEHRMAYCVRDRAYVDARIHEFLDGFFDGRMPLIEVHVDEVIRMTRVMWAQHMKTEARDLVEERVRATWKDPPVRFLDRFGGAIVELGVPPGELQLRRGEYLMVSPLVRDGELSTTELARLLDHYGRAYRKQKTIRLQIDVPQPDPRRYRRFDVRYFRKADKVVVFDRKDRDVAWSTGRLGPKGFTPYLEGKRSLHTSKLQRCEVDTWGKLPRCGGDGGPSAGKGKAGKAEDDPAEG